MTVSRKLIRHTPRGLAFAALLSLFMVIQTLPAWSAGQKTTFLPLNVHSPQDARLLETAADKELQAVLGTTDIAMIPRGEAVKLLNYQNAWPPHGRSP